MTESAIKDPSPAEGNRFDTSISVRAVAYFLLGFAISMILVFAAVWFLQRSLTRTYFLTSSVERSPTTLPQPLQPSPEHPTLPWQDMAALRTTQEQRLNSAGPNHVPIQKAMDNLLKSGALTQPWKNPTTQPYQRPPTEEKPSVENRT